MNALKKMPALLKFSRQPYYLILAIILASGVSQAQTVSDTVAVQLLNRLSQLEKELSELRGENEVLRNELGNVQNLQREGFLDVDERLQELKKIKKELANRSINNAPVLPSEKVSGNNGLESAAKPLDSGDIPALEAVVIKEEKEKTPTTIGVSVDFSKNTPVKTNDQANNQANNNESYYYYNQSEDLENHKNPSTGTDENTDKNKAKTGISGDKQPEKSTTTTASVIKKQSMPSIPTSHQAKAAYNQAYKTLVDNPAEAIIAFRSFLKKYPEHELRSNAQYWLGEALYAEKDFSAAAKEFMVVLRNYKDSAKAPGAALKLGYSFYELKKWDFARRTLEDTIRFFPNSNSANLARARLKRMDKNKR